jgi:hypothetical protein
MSSVYYDEKGKFFTPVVSKEEVPAMIQTLTHRLHGTIHVRQGERVKDELNRDEPFLAVTNVEIYNTRGEVLYRCQFMPINRSHIIWLIPDDQLKPGETEGGPA